jgi:hypothetical protein
MNAIKTDARYGVDMTDRLAAYNAVERQAREAYDAVRRPAWEVCDAIERQARGAYDAIERQAWGAYDAVRRQARGAYDAIERQAWEAYDAVRRPAWGALTCGDPLVDWIIEHASGYEIEAIAVLSALPATLAELDALAENAGWCGTWDALRDTAIRDGVIS